MGASYISSILHKPADSNDGWGVLGATFWGAMAFLAPQFWVGAMLPLIEGLPLAANIKTAVEEILMRLLVLGVILWVVFKVYHLNWSSLGYRSIKLRQIGWTATAYVAYVAITVLAVSFIAIITKVNLDQPQDIGFVSPSAIELFFAFVVLVLLTPFVEETLFRGFLFRAYRRRFGLLIATLSVSLLFAAVHAHLNVQIDVFVFSLVLCYLRERTDNLWSCVILHMLKNSVAFIVFYHIILFK